MDIDTSKEILTLDSVKKDLMQIAFDRTRRLLISIPLWWLWFRFMALCLNWPSEFKSTINITFLSLFLLRGILIICFIFIVQTERFTVSSGILSKKRNYKPRLTLFFFNIVYRLSFKNGMHYTIRRNRYYAWSAAYIMNENELFTTSCIDDSFTFITLGRRILILYNDKLFDTSAIQYSE